MTSAVLALAVACSRSQDRAAVAVVDIPPPAWPEDPTTVPHLPAPRIVALAAGDGTTCARFSDARVRCRGHLTLLAGALDGALEVSDVEVCARTAGEQRCIRDGVDRRVQTAFVQVARGAGARVGRDAEGRAWTFVGDTEDGARLIRVPLPAPAVSVVADGQRSCALLADQRLVCWDPYAAMSGTPEVRTLAEDVLGVDASYLRLCWHTAEAVQCWSEGRPYTVAGVPGPTAVAVGRHHGCALTGDGVACWKTRRASAVQLPDGAPPITLEAGDDHTCVLRDDGTAWCWGRDDAGQATGPWP